MYREEDGRDSCLSGTEGAMNREGGGCELISEFTQLAKDPSRDPTHPEQQRNIFTRLLVVILGRQTINK